MLGNPNMRIEEMIRKLSQTERLVKKRLMELFTDNLVTIVVF